MIHTLCHQRITITEREPMFSHDYRWELEYSYHFDVNQRCYMFRDMGELVDEIRRSFGQSGIRALSFEPQGAYKWDDGEETQ